MWFISKKELKYRARYWFLKWHHISSDDSIAVMKLKFEWNKYVDNMINKIQYCR